MATTTKGTRSTGKTTTKKTTAKKTGSKKKAPARTLLVVESPSKAKVISKYLGSKYKVIASVGHVRDLPKSRLAVDIDNNFEPEYINIKGKAPIINELKKEAAAAVKVLLATDPDREGEAIAWHLATLLGLDPGTDCRVMFNEINKQTVQDAIKDPKPINLSLVGSQQARRVLDRLVGYQISPLLWKKVARNTSGGRVQSSALKIICDREKEIQNFIPEEYWYIAADFGSGFIAELSKISGKKAKVTSKEQTEAIKAELDTGSYIVNSIKEGKRQTKPYAPFTTSSLQQEASIKLGFSTAKTMEIAQELYEGVSLKGIGARGLITYLRTDSVRISPQAKAMALTYIKDNFGEDYVGNNYFSNKKKNLQDAHEAIRPSDVNLEPDAIKESLSNEQYKLYQLIWKRFVASQMAAAQFDTVSVAIKNGRYEFKANGSRLTFDGWKKVYASSSNDKDVNIPPLTEGQVLELYNLITEQKFTQPPARFTEASLVKEMEDKNIGRPSTYASTIAILFARKYIKREKKSLMPTKLGFDVTGILEDYFSDIVDVEFTGEMEDKLDSVELGNDDWHNVVSDFYTGFSEELKKADEEVERIEREVIPSDEICEVCGKPMVYKEGSFGRFLACSGYPECKNTKTIIKSTGVKCPECGKDIIEKRGHKSGRVFYGCSGYPECSVSYWDLPVGRKCPDCGSMLVQTKGKTPYIKCSNHDCKYKERTQS